MSRFFSCAARTGAYLITFLLALVWIVGALDTLLHPFTISAGITSVM